MSTQNRYQRQITLPEVGQAGQEKISAAAVLCIGAGGLGCPALLYLAAAGVGRIGIIDFDSVDETNLHRQVLFTHEDIGQNKALAAAKRLSALNPDITIEPHAEELSDQNAEKLFERYDLIIDGTDNFSTKFLINDAALKTGKPFIYGSILGFDGQISVFNLRGGPCYRCLFPHAPENHVPNCAEAGVIGAVAGTIGTMQAMEALKIILAHESFKPLAGTLWTLDMRTMETKALALPKDPQCPACTQSKKDVILEYSSPVCGLVQEVTPQQARENKDALLIDVREQEEWNAGHIEGAQHMPLSGLKKAPPTDLPSDCDIILHCKSGRRSLQAAQILKSLGYLNVISMAGGYEAWCAQKRD